MKILFSCLFFWVAELHAQEIQCKQNFIDIAALEQKRFTSSNNNVTKTFASSNYTIYYSRCVWKIDPGVRYIEGKVTSYITASTSTNKITFDLNVSDDTATTTFQIDRTKFGIKYGSASFFDGLKDKAIYNEFDLKVSLKF